VPSFHLNWNYPSWSISSEWFAYLCFPLFCVAILRRITTRVRAYAFLALCVGMTVGLYVLGNEVPFHGLLQVVPTFLAGMAIFACQPQITQSQRYHAPLTTHHLPDFLIVLLAAIPLLTSGPIMVALLLAGFVVLVYRLAIQHSECSQFWTNRYAVYLGEISYSLYMAHTLTQKVCYKLLPADQFSGATFIIRSGVLLVYATGISIFVLGTYYLVEKPSRRALRRLFRNGDETHQRPPVSSLAA
jgi:peptidoglycan/LPS O-acetylase OafA/YrhL